MYITTKTFGISEILFVFERKIKLMHLFEQNTTKQYYCEI